MFKVSDTRNFYTFRMADDLLTIRPDRTMARDTAKWLVLELLVLLIVILAVILMIATAVADQ